MGNHPNISASAFPRQRDELGWVVDVCFHYDTSKIIPGVIVRSDAESPHVVIIRLNDGRMILAGECQYSPARASRRDR